MADVCATLVPFRSSEQVSTPPNHSQSRILPANKGGWNGFDSFLNPQVRLRRRRLLSCGVSLNCAARLRNASQAEPEDGNLVFVILFGLWDPKLFQRCCANNTPFATAYAPSHTLSGYSCSHGPLLLPSNHAA